MYHPSHRQVVELLAVDEVPAYVRLRKQGACYNLSVLELPVASTAVLYCAILLFAISNKAYWLCSVQVQLGSGRSYQRGQTERSLCYLCPSCARRLS